MVVKVATWNVNGIRKRSSEVMSWLIREDPDVVCLQETKATADQVPEPLCALPDYHCHWHGSPGGYSGVALLLHRRAFPAAPAFTHPAFAFENRLAVAEVGDTVFGSLYAPNGGKDFAAKLRFLHDLDAWAGELHAAGKRLVLAGDFNVARAPIDVHPSLRKDMIGQLAEERALIERLYAHGLVDVVRHTDPANDRLFTWWAPWRNQRARNIGWRLDHVAASADLVDATTTCTVAREVGTSDHGPVVAHLRDAPAPR